MWKRPIRAAVRIGLGYPRVRSLVESELKARRTLPRAPSPSVEREFIDRHGVHHPLDPTLRDRLKSGWRTMVDPEIAATPPSDEVLRSRTRKAVTVVAEASALIAAATGEPLAARILEVGCYDGANAYQLSLRTGGRVIASDLPRYYVIQRPGASVDPDLTGQRALLADIRARSRLLGETAAADVEFIEDDITRSGLPSASLDAIVSFEVLEHVQEPRTAFEGMARLLRPGGIVFHDYNPFFSANGGHSLCTLDFPWGHARLDADDFERYVRDLRPSEADQALRFYRENLNRMTLADLRKAILGAGLEIVAVVPWTERGLVPRLDPELLAEVQRNYPTAVVDDLLSTFVAVIARRPRSVDGPTDRAS